MEEGDGKPASEPLRALPTTGEEPTGTPLLVDEAMGVPGVEAIALEKGDAACDADAGIEMELEKGIADPLALPVLLPVSLVALLEPGVSALLKCIG